MMYREISRFVQEGLRINRARVAAYVVKVIFLSVLMVSCANAQIHQDAESVAFEQLISELEIVAKELEPSDVLRSEFTSLQKSHGIADDEKIYQDFVRVRLAFETTRDSGLWQIRWTVTDNEPTSDAIWQQWQKHRTPKFQNERTAQATAVAECDELSALFAFIARSLGVKKVGLIWPTWNHVVAVWTTVDNQGNPVRIIVPTSQIFIDKSATLGTTEFDAYQQKVIYDYERRDVASSFRIPARMAEMMIGQARRFGSKPAAYLQARRNRLSLKLGGS